MYLDIGDKLMFIITGKNLEPHNKIIKGTWQLLYKATTHKHTHSDRSVALN